jgi:hypothetical protein
VLHIYIYDISHLRVKLGTFRWSVHVMRLQVIGLAEKILCTKPGGGMEREEEVITNLRRTSHGLRAESGEVMSIQERNGASSLRRSGPTQGRSTNGGSRRRLRCRPRHVLALLVPRAGPDSDEAKG